MRWRKIVTVLLRYLPYRVSSLATRSLQIIQLNRARTNVKNLLQTIFFASCIFVQTDATMNLGCLPQMNLKVIKFSLQHFFIHMASSSPYFAKKILNVFTLYSLVQLKFQISPYRNWRIKFLYFSFWFSSNERIFFFIVIIIIVMNECDHDSIQYIRST
jgi:hypothetical protein